MRSSSFLTLMGLAVLTRAASAQLPSREVRSILERVAVDANGRGYHHPPGAGEMIPALAGGMPQVKAPPGATFAEGQVRLRDCSREERRRYHPCVRADVVSMLAYDSTGGQVALSVIPQSFLGDSLGDALETPASPEVLADAELIARGVSGSVLRLPMPSPSEPSGETAGGAPSAAPRLSADPALGLARIEATREGYRMGGESARLLQPLLALGPSPAATGWEWVSPMLKKHECSREQAAAHPHCVRVEWLEIFYGPVPPGKDQQVGVIPHTIVGTSSSDIVEVEADSEVVAAAGKTADRSQGRVVHAIPWQTPVAAPGTQ